MHDMQVHMYLHELSAYAMYIHMLWYHIYLDAYSTPSNACSTPKLSVLNLFTGLIPWTGF